MDRFAAILVCCLLAPCSAFGQTREETVNFITGEYRSFETRDLGYKEITFSPDASTFTLRRSAFKHKDRAVSFRLDQVDIYLTTVNNANGINKYRLMVRTRGRGVTLLKDGRTYAGATAIAPTMTNERKGRALERAFTRLIMLTTGRRFLFDPLLK